MEIPFYKYHGTGNDFVMVDNRNAAFPKNDTNLVAHLCDRRFGIGADGLILLETDKNSDFRMVYYNSDGNLSSMCGNGGRCIVAFAKQLGIIQMHTNFIATDGPHFATIGANGIVSLQMKDVDEVKIGAGFTFVDTGSPHHIEFADLETIDIRSRGAEIRYSEKYGPGGSNVNFVQQLANDIFAVRTYERGVEDETLSCGTGVTAVAIAMNATKRTGSNVITLEVQGGKLEVSFDHSDGRYTNVFLKGPAQFVFSGLISVDTKTN